MVNRHFSFLNIYTNAILQKIQPGQKKKEKKNIGSLFLFLNKVNYRQTKKIMRNDEIKERVCAESV